MRELRTEKPWRNNEGPGFKSRQLHFLHFPWSLMTGGFALSVQVNAGVIDKGRLVVVSPYGAFLQIVNKKRPLSARLFAKMHHTHDYPRHDYLRWDVLSPPRWGEYHRFSLLVPTLAQRGWDGAVSDKDGKTI